jgi:hypothetical protein
LNEARNLESKAKLAKYEANKKLDRLVKNNPEDSKIAAAKIEVVDLTANYDNLNEKYLKAIVDYEIEGIRLKEERGKAEAHVEREQFEKKHKGKGYELPLPPGEKNKQFKED